MKTLISLISLILCAATFPALAQSREGIANMRAQCECVMSGGVCQVINATPPRPGSRMFTPAGPIPAENYNRVRARGPLMCSGGTTDCTNSWEGGDCKAFRLMFRQEPIDCLVLPK